MSPEREKVVVDADRLQPKHLGPDLRQRLFDEYKIETTAYTWRDRPLIRVSIQAYNNQDDVDRLLDALAGLSRDGDQPDIRADAPEETV